MKRAPSDFRVFLTSRRGAWTGIIVGPIVALVLLPTCIHAILLPGGDFVAFPLFGLCGGGLGVLLGGIVNLIHLRKRSLRR